MYTHLNTMLAAGTYICETHWERTPCACELGVRLTSTFKTPCQWHGLPICDFYTHSTGGNFLVYEKPSEPFLFLIPSHWLNMSDFSQWKTCAITIPPGHDPSVSPETAVGNRSVKPSSGVHVVLTKLNDLWDNGTTIRYAYMDGTVNQHNKFVQVVQE
ncbi:hypothetical protein C8J57DRAFT_597985 [Mycena rebaudengoi]|nr:hypothetical protein C8J57DRAFT_597985 [Mycena rebaudengoi]